jgi:2-oxoisovalerate dehydrogenase E1 component
VRGIKVCYPSNAADLKGLIKAAFLDPNPVVMFEHKGLYWSKNPGTDEAKTIEPDEDYVIPLGKANIVQQASQEQIEEGIRFASSPTEWVFTGQKMLRSSFRDL